MWTQSKIKHKSTPSSSINGSILKAGLLFISLTLLAYLQVAKCEAKEFDWSELGVSLGAPKSSLSASNAQNNLRILVSPQRRMTKNYEFEYTNGTQGAGGQSEASYVIPGSNGNSAYLTQSVGQLSPSHSGHSSAYSALSASLASLKNRLSARGVSLSSSLSESNVSNLYPAGGSSYGSSLLLDSQQAQQAQAQPQAQQPTYLSVTSQADQSSANLYPSSHNQSNDNKTIVLAIPAKINFLTDRSKQQQQQQQQPQQQQPQPQQLTVLQQAGEQSGRAEYQPKQQIGVMSSQEGAVDQSGQVMATSVGNPEQEHHQYVIVNSPQQPAEHTSHIMATNAGPMQSHAPITYSSVYPTVQQGNLGSFSMKYIPSYTQTQTVQQPTVQKIYAPVEHPSQPMVEQPEQPSRYSSCLDTCNSADPRWRKYSVSKYKYCCSHSSQYDQQFDVPSAEKVGEMSNKYADDAYYSYLYRRTRARRSRKSRARNHRYFSMGASSAGSNSNAEEESADPSSDSRGSTSGRSYHESPYMKYYKIRQQQSAANEAPESAPRDAGAESPASAGKYSSAKEGRSYRRGRNRDYEAPESSPAHEANDEEAPSAYNQRETTRGYGNGDYSVESGRYSSDSRAPAEDEEPRGAGGYEEPPESDVSKTTADIGDYPAAGDQAVEGGQYDEAEPETSGAAYKHPSSSTAMYARRRKHGRAGSRGRKAASQSGKDSKYYKKGGRKSNRYNKQDYSSSQANATDYEAAQAGDQYHSEQPNSNEDDQSSSSYQKDSTGSEANGDSSDPMSMNNKYKQSLNESTVAHLSKTTMHLKEILSILEKKAQLRSNESYVGQANQSATSTPAPTTTTSIYSPSLFSSAFSSPSLSSSLSSDFLGSELSLKSPYRLEPPSLGSSLSSPSLSMPSSFGSMASEYGSLSAFGPPPSHYGSMSQIKHMPMSQGHHPRKRRVNKNMRYNSMMMQKHHGHMGPTASQLLHAASKSSLMNNPYYAALQYPYWYTRGSSPAVTNSYPYKNVHKPPPYPSLLNGPVSSKLAAAAAASGSLYSDDSPRYHGMSGYDPIANVASSIRPSTTMRLRTKPFVLQPQVLPIYTRHTILTQPLDVKK